MYVIQHIFIIGNTIQIVIIVYNNLTEFLPKTPQQYVYIIIVYYFM